MQSLDNENMDEKREFLLRQLFGDENNPAQMPKMTPEQLQRLAKAQQKAEKINETLEDSERTANILRHMMGE